MTILLDLCVWHDSRLTKHTYHTRLFDTTLSLTLSLSLSLWKHDRRICVIIRRHVNSTGYGSSLIVREYVLSTSLTANWYRRLGNGRVSCIVYHVSTSILLATTTICYAAYWQWRRYALWYQRYVMIYLQYSWPFNELFVLRFAPAELFYVLRFAAVSVVICVLA